jgi:hypothetical protein
MGLTDLIDRVKELFGEGGIDSLTDKAGELSDIAQGEGSVLDKGQEAIESLGDAGGEAAEGSAEPPSGPER